MKKLTKKAKKSKVISVRLDMDIVERLAALAEGQNTTSSDIVKKMILKEIG